MQINNWSELLKSKRLAKTPRNLDNDLVIIGTNTPGGLKKQDTWQPYVMTLADLANTIGGGGGSFTATPQGVIQINGGTSPVSVSAGDTITFNVPNIPNNLVWKEEWNSATNYVVGDAVYYIDTTPDPDVYRTYVAIADNINQTPPTGTNFDTYWAMLGMQGPSGTPSNSSSFKSAQTGALVVAADGQKISHSVLIPGGTFQTDDSIVIEALFGSTKSNTSIASGGAGYTKISVLANTTNNLSGSPIIIHVAGNGSSFFVFNNCTLRFRLGIRDQESATTKYLGTTAASQDISGSNQTPFLTQGPLAIDWTVDQYILFTIQLQATSSATNAVMSYLITQN
jgi:hypothetical protein